MKNRRKAFCVFGIEKSKRQRQIDRDRDPLGKRGWELIQNEMSESRCQNSREFQIHWSLLHPLSLLRESETLLIAGYRCLSSDYLLEVEKYSPYCHRASRFKQRRLHSLDSYVRPSISLSVCPSFAPPPLQHIGRKKPKRQREYKIWKYVPF